LKQDNQYSVEHLVLGTGRLKVSTKTGKQYKQMSQSVYQKVSGLSRNEINNNKHSLRSNTKGYGGKTH